MNGKSAHEVIGKVVRVDVSGIGINSGELTVVIQTEHLGDVTVFAGVKPSEYDTTKPTPWKEYCMENDVFASYVNLATTAYAFPGKRLWCSYIFFDKNRINVLSLRD